MAMTDIDLVWVRTQDAPTLPPPPSEVGVVGWLWHNIFSSMSNYHSVGAAIQSIAMTVLTFGVLYVFVSGIWSLVDFAFIQAIWSDADEQKRLICATTLQGGVLAADWYGACWPFIAAKAKLLVYGRYDASELWRVDIVYAAGAIGLFWALYEPLPGRTWAAILMLTVFPVASFILLTGGHLDFSPFTFGFWGIGAAILLGLGYLGATGRGGAVLEGFSTVFLGIGAVFASILVVALLFSIDFGLPFVATEEWGGLLVTLVVAVTGIVASLPLGILLALGRRSNLPLIRTVCVIFIEFWRGVPLITVLFMSSVMLPLFLPEGTEFNKLLRALIGVALFSAAYMAEVVRGGLQAIPNGQFEGAAALGLSYGPSMRLIVLPQALVLVIPGIVNTFIGLFKDTTLVLIIGLFDLLGQMQATFTDASWSTPVQSMTGYLTVAAIFWIFCFGMSRYSMFMERKLRHGHNR
jgi:general L-amino acid transport system permease protein